MSNYVKKYSIKKKKKDHVCILVLRSEEGVGFPGFRVTGNWELSDKNSGNESAVS